MTASTAGTAIDQVALVPAYVAAGTAVLALLVDLAAPGRRLPVLAVTMSGALGTAWACWWAYPGGGPGSVARTAFCGDALCSYEWDRRAMVVGIAFALATACVVGLSVPVLRTGDVPAGEYAFLLACSLTGAVVLGASRDLVTLIIALETLTLPLYVLVGLRRRSAESAEAAVTFLIVSVVSTAVTLLGAALLYAATGTVHFTGLRAALASREALLSVPMVGVAVVAVLVGLAFKVAAVPFHAWAPATYDGAPLPVAAYLSTASKLGGVVAILAVAVGALGPWLDVAGPVLALLAVATMTVGNLVALRQQRMVRLLAWSSVAQAGYLLAPLGVFALADGRTDASTATAVAAVLAYTIFYILLELVAFGCVIALRGGADGGTLADYREASRQRPWVTAAFVLALTGLAGLPPGLAGLFAKVTVVSSLLQGASGWLALVVALNAVVGLAYYLRASLALFGRFAVGAGAAGAGAGGPVGAIDGGGAGVAGDPPVPAPRSPLPVRVGIPLLVGLVLVVTTAGAVVVGFAPQLVLDAVTLP